MLNQVGQHWHMESEQVTRKMVNNFKKASISQEGQISTIKLHVWVLTSASILQTIWKG